MRPKSIRLKDLVYVEQGHERHTLDLYLPEGDKPLPLIIWVHGGAFLEGDKTNGVPVAYLAEGYAVASINYRLSSHALFPVQIEDCKTAVRWLRANADGYGLDPERFVAWGVSSGGHLAAMLGTTGESRDFDVGDNLHVSSRVQAVIDFYGPTDFLQMDQYRTDDGMLHDPEDSPESLLIGGPIQEHKDKVAAASPLSYITPQAPPFLIVHGDRDPLVPHHQSLLLESVLQQAGVPVRLYTVKGQGHGRFRDPEVARITREFLRDYIA